MTSPRRRAPAVNDLDLSRWREYEDLLTDSLWLLDARDSSGAHQPDYHGNFIPQIPYQLLRRFTRAGEVVLDPFIGSGTTAIEAQRLGRRCVGVELSPTVAEVARQRVVEDWTAPRSGASPDIQFPVRDDIITGDSSLNETAARIAERLAAMGRETAQCVVMHPPYHNIIRFSDIPGDLSACETVGQFVERFLSVYRNVERFLDGGRHLAVVIGDMYDRSEWVPLQNLLTTALLDTGQLRLKSIIVKNMVNNRAKRNQEHLWRYRALANGFYVFRHEYIVLFQKIARPRERTQWRPAR